MEKAIKMDINPQAVIEAVKRMNKDEREDFLENLLAATSPEYLDSIKAAREDYRVIFDIENDNIVVLRIGHHKEIYRR